MKQVKYYSGSDSDKIALTIHVFQILQVTLEKDFMAKLKFQYFGSKNFKQLVSDTLQFRNLDGLKVKKVFLNICENDHKLFHMKHLFFNYQTSSPVSGFVCLQNLKTLITQKMVKQYTPTLEDEESKEILQPVEISEKEVLKRYNEYFF